MVVFIILFFHQQRSCVGFFRFFWIGGYFKDCLLIFNSLRIFLFNVAPSDGHIRVSSNPEILSAATSRWLPIAAENAIGIFPLLKAIDDFLASWRQPCFASIPRHWKPSVRMKLLITPRDDLVAQESLSWLELVLGRVHALLVAGIHSL